MAATRKTTAAATKATPAAVEVAPAGLDMAALAASAKTVAKLPKAPRAKADNPFQALVDASYAEKVTKQVGPMPTEAVRPVENAIRRAAYGKGISVTIVTEDGPTEGTTLITFQARDKQVRPSKTAE